MRTTRGGRTVIFTIASANYISFAATLMQSVRAQHPDAIRVIVLADTKRSFPDIDLAAELLSCDELGISQFEGMKLFYSVIEYNTALKPYVFLWAFEHYGAQFAAYIDPDIRLFEPMHEVFCALRTHSIVLTPHHMVPLQDGKEPSDHTIMKSGVYNFGFFAARNNDDAKRLIHWWADRCLAHCRVDIPGHMFTDQRWMDLAPVLVEKPLILRHPGYNVAYWNLAHRTVRRRACGKFTVNGKKLVFFHFSGIKPDDPKIFSKHQNRFTADSLGVVGVLCSDYRKAVLANRWKHYSTSRYSFDHFADGSRIEDAMRHWLLRAIDNGMSPGALPQGLNAAFFDQPEDGLEQTGAVITRFMMQLWLDRSDLRAAFTLTTSAGRAAYLNWFLSQAGEQGVSRRTVAAAEQANGVGAAGPMPVQTPQRTPPWPSLAQLEGVDPALSAYELLQRDIAFVIDDQRVEIPAAAALLWETRRDLQGAFPLVDDKQVMSYLAWVMTDGMQSGAVREDHLSARFREKWAKVSRISGLYRDVPLTEGMIVTRGAMQGRDGFADSTRFPTDPRSRAAGGLWYAYWAPRNFHWPAEMVASVRAYFAMPTEVRVAGFALTRGEVALWELRPDLQLAFPLSDDLSVEGYLFWLASRGVDEIGITLEDFDPRLVKFFAFCDPHLPNVPRFVQNVYRNRPDLQQAFDLSARKGREGLAEWSGGEFPIEYKDTPFVRTIATSLATTSVEPVEVGVVLTGYWTAPTGRGEDLRCTDQCLRAVGYRDYLIADLASHSFFDPDGVPQSITGPIRARINIVHTNADTVIADDAVMREMSISAQHTIGYWAWELERLPSWWRYAYIFYDEIWASTRFAYDAFEAEQLRPVSLIPLAVHLPEKLPLLARGAYGWANDETVFLFVFDLRSFVARKNPGAAVKAFRQAFPKGDEKVRLVIKTQGGKDRPVELEALRELCTDPRIDLIDAILPREEILSLIRSADCFVSLHRTEGFGRGPAEAMLLGKPVVLTDYSGTTDFANQNCALPVAYELVPVRPEEYPGVEHQRWADPKVESAAEEMRLVHEQPARMARLGKRARARIVKQFSPRVVGKTIVAHLGLSEEGGAVAQDIPEVPISKSRVWADNAGNVQLGDQGAG